MKNMIQIGIDPGKNTGFAVAENGVLREIGCLKIHHAMKAVSAWKRRAADTDCGLMVYVEDARQRKWFKGSADDVRSRLQGAGSIKRDCSIWADFLEDEGVAVTLVAPKNNRTKMNHADFARLTGWEKQTNEHGRDAAMLVFGRKF
ncbi:MAG: hypothetical protein Q4G42_03595 [Neisseria sp.]|nr:hypothetical protein [Neisseria sp.]